MPVTGDTILSRVLMVRDVEALTSRTFDVLVVGGGIYGLWIAYDAAQRGLSVALIERRDFGAGASFNHLRTIHGGLRYLQTLDVRRARESLRERRTLARIAPHAVQPLPFVLPVYRGLAAGKTAMRAGFLLDRAVEFDRNQGVPPGARLPGPSLISRAEALRRFPALKSDGLTAAAVWHDYVAAEADRLTFSVAQAASEHGAALVNHVDAVSLIAGHRTVTGVRARDDMSGCELEIGARLTINATGGALDHLLTPLGLATSLPHLTAVNLVTRRPAAEVALGGRGHGRTLFLVPWHGRMLAGTWESPASPANEPRVDRVEIEAFVRELNQVFPTLELRLEEVTLVHRGVVPAVRSGNGRIGLEGRERLRDHAADGIEGLASVAGVKYTTARAVAERIVDLAARKLGREPTPCRTASTPLSGMADAACALPSGQAPRDVETRLTSETVAHLRASYGSRCREVLQVADERRELRAPLDEQSPVVGAQLVWAVRQEMAVTLEDAVIRRTPLGALGCPSAAALESSSVIVGAELGWSDERRRQEVAAVERFYEWRS
jgi:glycerol-3-phosphate dehydrogenase